MDAEEHSKTDPLLDIIDFVSLCLSSDEATALSSSSSSSSSIPFNNKHHVGDEERDKGKKKREEMKNNGKKSTLFGLYISPEVDFEGISRLSHFIKSQVSHSLPVAPSPSFILNGFNPLANFISEQANPLLPDKSSPSPLASLDDSAPIVPNYTPRNLDRLSNVFLHTPYKASTPPSPTLPCPPESSLPQPRTPCYSILSGNQSLPTLLASPSKITVSEITEPLQRSVAASSSLNSITSQDSLQSSGTLDSKGSHPPPPNPLQGSPQTQDAITRKELQPVETPWIPSSVSKDPEVRREVTPKKRNDGSSSDVDLLEIHPSPSQFFDDIECSSGSLAPTSSHSKHDTHLSNKRREKDELVCLKPDTRHEMTSSLPSIIKKNSTEKGSLQSAGDNEKVHMKREKKKENYEELCRDRGKQKERDEDVCKDREKKKERDEEFLKDREKKEDKDEEALLKSQTPLTLCDKTDSRSSGQSNKDRSKHQSSKDRNMPQSNKDTSKHQSNKDTSKHQSNKDTSKHRINKDTSKHQSNKDTNKHRSNKDTSKHQSNKDTSKYLPKAQRQQDKGRSHEEESGSRASGRGSHRVAENIESRAIEGQVSEKGGEPIKSYMVPFVSDNPQENKDNEDPGWSYLKLLKTDAERYQQTRRLWKSVVVPDPNVNQTYSGYLSCEEKASTSTHVQQPKKRKREEERGRHGQPPEKRRKFNDISFSIRRIHRSMADVTEDYVSDLRERCRTQAEAMKLQRIHNEKQHQLLMACSEVQALHNFYSGLPDQDKSVTQDMVEHDQEEMEQLYQCFRTVYGWNGRCFFP
ncbi:hypothetical protein Pcinc_026684 [Petrolisthes cinctipes]|uniref:Uncharacterized protein n=1 Tax=Petrolisthes cinctipes TaxID=88211 RepID=A0AAE1F6X7_PETCI|nr:hypothetical protein Pcinc_026684 [Petrolisthes cinctipes]